MAAPRKVFRIEETPAARVAAGGARASERQAETMQAQNLQAQDLQAQVLQELAALRSAFATSATPTAKPDISGAATGRLTSELHLIAGRLAGGAVNDGGEADTGEVPLTRIANELLAVTAGTEQATQKILAAAEEIDQLANNLSAALKGKIEQGLAQDIQDLVIRIFEACNFQDLIGQRVSKVMTTLKFVEDQITSVLDEIKNMSARPSGEAAQYLHGPRLGDDTGHVSQTDIDAIFDT
jgi:chemotaxis regulatin CheY-phosphate phosphatase CheZ